MDSQLLSILACPRCHGDLTLKSESAQDIGLICAGCSVMYPIREGIPIMLVDEALSLGDGNNDSEGETGREA